MSTNWWTGTAAIGAALGAVQDRIHDGGRVGLDRAASNVLNVSNQQVPHEEGTLELDGDYKLDPQRLLAAIGYGIGAEAAEYAVPQHERLDYHHDSGRNAKFLENALNQTREQNLEIVGQAIRERLNQ